MHREPKLDHKFDTQLCFRLLQWAVVHSVEIEGSENMNSQFLFLGYYHVHLMRFYITSREKRVLFDSVSVNDEK